MQHVDLVGRDDELTVLSAAVDAAVAGRSSVVGVFGPAGVGKSRLLAEVAGRARAAGVVVRPTTAELSEAFVPWSGVRGWNLAGETDPLRVLLAAMTAPTLLIADDVHWADSASVSLLRALVSRRLLIPIVLVVAMRPAPDNAELGDLAAELRSAGPALDLNDLADDQVTVLLSEIIGAEPGPRLRAMAAEAGGNPFLIAWLVRAARQQGRLQRFGSEMDLTPGGRLDLDTVLAWWMRGVSESRRQVLRAIAVLGDGAPADAVAVVSGRPLVETAETLLWAAQVGLLAADTTTVRFEHALVREAVYREVPPSARQLLHRLAADALNDAGAGSARAAEQLLLSADVGDSGVVGRIRSCAAELRPYAPQAAADLVSAALQIAPEETRAPIRLELAEALLASGSATRAATVLGDVIADTRVDPAVRQAACLHLLPIHILRAELDEAAVLARTMRVLPGAVTSDQRRLLDLLVHGAGLHEPRSVGRLEAAVTEMTTSPMLHFLTSVVLSTHGRWSAALHEMQLARAAGSVGGGSEAEVFEVLYALVIGRSDEVDRVLAGARREHADDPLFGATDLFARVVRARWDGVDELHRRLCSSPDGNPLAFAFHAFVASLLARLRSDVNLADDVTALLTAGRVDDARDWMSLSNRRAAQANALVAKGRIRDAAHLVVLAVEDAERGGHIGLTQKIANHVGTLLDAGSEFRPAAVRLGLLLDEAQRREHSPTAALHVVWKEALLGDDPALHLEALARCTRESILYDRGEILERAAACLHRHGDQTRALELLRDAASWYESARAWPALSRVRGRLRDQGVRLAAPRTGGELTASERAVADLARSGLTNVAIGQRLAISSGTVGTHLSRVYRKLGISSRSQLTRPG